MQNEFAPYPEALAMKELGFNEPCLINYNHSKIFVFPNMLLWKSTANTNSRHQNDSISAPLYQQAFRWFREKYNLIGTIEVYYNPHKLDKLFYEYGISTKENTYEGLLVNAANRVSEDWMKEPAKYNLYDTYEEAQLACLQELIKIVQDDNNKELPR